MKKLALFSILILLQAVEVQAQMSTDMTEEAFMAEAENDKKLQSDMMERLSLLDINGDGAISSTEIEEMVKGMEAMTALSDEEKKATIANIRESFEKADADKDNMLKGDEIEAFGKLMQTFLLKQQFRKMDRNGDGVINQDDIPSMEESVQKLEEAVKKMQEAVEKVNAMDENELAQNFIQNINLSVAKEDYYQMDKNHDNCVTKEEYADYNVAAQQEKQNDADIPEDEKIILSREAYLSLYTREKKKNPACLTMEEYVANQSKLFDDVEEDDAEIGALIFAEMDADQDGKVTQEEFVAYEMSTNSDNKFTKEDIIGMFKQTKGAEKGWLSKEEYVSDYVAIGEEVKNDISKD